MFCCLRTTIITPNAFIDVNWCAIRISSTLDHSKSSTIQLIASSPLKTQYGTYARDKSIFFSSHSIYNIQYTCRFFCLRVIFSFSFPLQNETLEVIVCWKALVLNAACACHWERARDVYIEWLFGRRRARVRMVIRPSYLMHESTEHNHRPSYAIIFGPHLEMCLAQMQTTLPLHRNGTHISLSLSRLLLAKHTNNPKTKSQLNKC